MATVNTQKSAVTGIAFIVGVALLLAAGIGQLIVSEFSVIITVLALAGIVLAAWGGYALRAELAGMFLHRRGEILLNTAGLIGILVAVAWLSMRFPVRFDLTTTRAFSLQEATVQMLKRLDKPVHVVFFNDPMMRDTVEVYQQMAAVTDKLTVEFYDPMLNPAQARMRGVEFAGTAIYESEGRKMQVNGPTETDIANGILRISQGVQQTVCFLDGHGEPDPFSLESHDHSEGNPGHTHGIGAKVVNHERHGMAKARNGLETLNYAVKKVSLLQAGTELKPCTVLVVAGPKSPLLEGEIKAIDKYLADGGNAMFMLDPFVRTGLEPVVREFGVILDEDIIIDEASHFWTDVSSPAVTDYNRHEITRDLPLTFYPGARSLSPTSERVPGTAVRPLVNSSKTSYGGTNRDRAEYDKAKDQAGPLTIMVSVNRKPEFVEATETVTGGERKNAQAQRPTPLLPDAKPATTVKNSRVIVVGDSDFATNSFFHILGNGTLFLNCINYLAAQENLIGLEPRTFDIPRVNLTNRQMKGTVVLSIIFIPALMGVIGIVVWWRRR
ncbi:MAG TPA: Gldg family protein [Burkholderiales bacterium]|nr:Gldg family protein [Burkholderiales bacterium]